MVQSLNFVQYFNSSAFLSRKRMQNYCFTTYLPNTSSTFFSNSCNFFAKSLIQRCVFQHKNIAVSQNSITAIPYYLRTRALHTSKQGKSFLTPRRWMPAFRYVHPTFGYPEGLQRPFLKTPWRLRKNIKAFWPKWLDVLTRPAKHIPIRLDKLNYTLSLIDMRESSNFAFR